MEWFLYDRDLHHERVKGVRRRNLDFHIPTVKRRINCEISKMQRILLKINYQDAILPFYPQHIFFTR